MLLIFAISLASCTSFDWEPRPYVGDSEHSQIINEHGESVQCAQPEFDTYTCFDEDNIAELKSAIDQINDKQTRLKALSILNRI